MQKDSVTYPLNLFLGFPTFYYESNNWWGKIDSLETLYQMLYCVSEYCDSPLKDSLNLIDGNGKNNFKSFGLYSEYKGKKSLLEYLTENGIKLKNYK